MCLIRTLVTCYMCVELWPLANWQMDVAECGQDCHWYCHHGHGSPGNTATAVSLSVVTL